MQAITTKEQLQEFKDNKKILLADEIMKKS